MSNLVRACNTCGEKGCDPSSVKCCFVPVVRCKDCIYSRERNSYEKEYLAEGVVICTNKDIRGGSWGEMYEDDFCSYCERKAVTSDDQC